MAEDSQDAVDRKLDSSVRFKALDAAIIKLSSALAETVQHPAKPAKKSEGYALTTYEAIVDAGARAVLDMQESEVAAVRRMNEAEEVSWQKGQEVTALRTALEGLMAWADKANNWNSLTAPPEFVVGAAALSVTKEGK